MTGDQVNELSATVVAEVTTKDRVVAQNHQRPEGIGSSRLRLPSWFWRRRMDSRARSKSLDPLECIANQVGATVGGRQGRRR